MLIYRSRLSFKEPKFAGLAEQDNGHICQEPTSCLARRMRLSVQQAFLAASLSLVCLMHK